MPIFVEDHFNAEILNLRYQGHVTVADGVAVHEQLSRDPNSKPGTRRFVDMTDLVSFDLDLSEFLKLQSLKAPQLMGKSAETLVVYLAPTEVAQKLARMIARSWDGFDGIVIRIVQTEAEARGILGLPCARRAALDGETF